MDALDIAAVSYQIVLTKADKLKASEVDAIANSKRCRHRQAPRRASRAARHLGGNRHGDRPAPRRHRGLGLSGFTALGTASDQAAVQKTASLRSKNGLAKAKTLAEALPYIQIYDRETSW